MTTDDQKWINQLCKGDEEAYRLFFEEYYQLLGVFAMKYIKVKETAEDIVNDVIVELYSRKPKFENLTALKSYLYLAIRNHCLNHLRHSKAQKHYLLDTSAQEKENFFLNNIIEEEIYFLLKKAINELPGKIRTIYELSLSGRSNEEIATELSLTIDSVKAHKKRGKQILREKLKGLVYLLLLPL